MTEFTYRDLLRILFPKGPVWAFKALGDADKLIDAIGATKETIRDYLKSAAYTRNPAQTPVLPDLEREFGVVPVTSLTEAERREILAGYAYAKPGSGVDDLQARLDAAGFTSLTVYQNSPVVDPDVYVSGEWSCVCGYQDSVCGNQEAYCGQTGVGGYILANGPVLESDGTEHDYEIPADDERWPMCFFIGGTKVSGGTGYVVILDGDMEYGTDPDSILVDGDMELTGTSAWESVEGPYTPA